MNKIFRLLLACIGMLLAVSCTKTDTIAPPARSQSRILEYRIVNVQGDPLVGSVNEKDSTITVYLPAYLQLVTLEPSIKVSEGATVAPAGSTLIEDLLQVFREGRDIKYVVTAKNGVKRTYTLKINVQQEPMIITEVSTPTTPREYKMSAFSQGVAVNLKGSGFNENRELMKAVLVDDDNKEYPLLLGLANLNDTYTINLNISKYDDLGAAILNFTGSKNYRVRLYNYSLQTTMQYAFKITKT